MHGNEADYEDVELWDEQMPFVHFFVFCVKMFVLAGQSQQIQYSICIITRKHQ